MSAGITSALPVTMKGFKDLLKSVSPDVSVCVRGRHAIGKSEGVHQGATEIFSDFYKDEKNQKKFTWTYEQGLPVVERRLSQMTEGDIIGLPYREGEDVFDGNGNRISYASTQFKPCDWLIQACVQPVVLFLDERNRALEGVKQAVFQLTDSKRFYGYVLHPETRIVIAENVGDVYQVNQCDPAEVSRCATVTLEPSVKEWLAYAADKCHPATLEYIRANETKLEHRGNFEPNKKYPDRRSWFKLDQELQRLDLFDEPNSTFRVLAGAMLGAEVGPSFMKFCKEREREVSGKDILADWSKARKRLAVNGHVSNEKYVECTGKLGDVLKKHTLTEKEGKQVAAFMKDCPAEVRMTVWATFQENPDNLLTMHPLAADLMVKTAKGVNVNTQAEDEEKSENKQKSENKKKTRGARKKQ